MLAQVGNLLSTFGTWISGFEVDKLRVRVVVRLLVRLVITELAAVPVKKTTFSQKDQILETHLKLEVDVGSSGT